MSDDLDNLKIHMLELQIQDLTSSLHLMEQKFNDETLKNEVKDKKIQKLSKEISALKKNNTLLTECLHENAVSLKNFSILKVTKNNLYNYIKSIVDKGLELLMQIEAGMDCEEGLYYNHPIVLEKIMKKYSKTVNVKNFWTLNPLYQTGTNLRPMFTFQNFLLIASFPPEEQTERFHAMIRKFSGSVSLCCSYLSKYDYKNNKVYSYFAAAISLYCYHILCEEEIRYPESSPIFVDYNDHDQYKEYIKANFDLDLKEIQPKKRRYQNEETNGTQWKKCLRFY